MGSGERRLWARSAHRSRPRRRFGYFAARGQSNPLSADSGIPPAKIYGPLITLGLQNHFHSRQPK